MLGPFSLAFSFLSTVWVFCLFFVRSIPLCDASHPLTLQSATIQTSELGICFQPLLTHLYTCKHLWLFLRFLADMQYLAGFKAFPTKAMGYQLGKNRAAALMKMGALLYIRGSNFTRLVSQEILRDAVPFFCCCSSPLPLLFDCT